MFTVLVTVVDTVPATSTMVLTMLSSLETSSSKKAYLSMGQPLEFISECTDKPVEYIRDIATEELMLVREENTYDRNIEKKSVE